MRALFVAFLFVRTCCGASMLQSRTLMFANVQQQTSLSKIAIEPTQPPLPPRHRRRRRHHRSRPPPPFAARPAAASPPRIPRCPGWCCGPA